MTQRLLEKIYHLEILRSFKIVWILMIFVVFYYVFIAADRYVSTMILDVRSTSSGIQSSSVLSLLNTTAATSEDLKYLKGFINSSDLLKTLDEKIKLKSLYQEQHIDLPFKIWDSSSSESYLQYYRSRVRLHNDKASGLLSVEVEAFTPETAHLIAQTIMEESEQFINEISHKAAREQMDFAENEVKKYKERYQKAQNHLIAFQNKYGVFDPLKQAENKATLVSQIEANLAQKEARLLTLQSYMNDAAPEIVALKAEIVAIKKQLDREMAKISTSNATEVKKLNDLAAQFQNLSIEAGFAQEAYKAALKAYETARIDAARKIKQLVIVQSPTLPESAKYPQRIYNILTAFMVLSLIYGIGKFVKMIIEEHKY